MTTLEINACFVYKTTAATTHEHIFWRNFQFYFGINFVVFISNGKVGTVFRFDYFVEFFFCLIIHFFIILMRGLSNWLSAAGDRVDDPSTAGTTYFVSARVLLKVFLNRLNGKLRSLRNSEERALSSSSSSASSVEIEPDMRRRFRTFSNPLPEAAW